MTQKDKEVEEASLRSMSRALKEDREFKGRLSAMEKEVRRLQRILDGNPFKRMFKRILGL